MSMYTVAPRSDELYHYGVLGMRWGVRRYQNYDGTLKHPKGEKQSNGSNSRKKLSPEQKKRIMKIAGGALLAGSAIAVGAYLAKHPEAIAKGARSANSILSSNPRIDIAKELKEA